MMLACGAEIATCCRRLREEPFCTNRVQLVLRAIVLQPSKISNLPRGNLEPPAQALDKGRQGKVASELLQQSE